jgi:hypothetical protein
MYSARSCIELERTRLGDRTPALLLRRFGRGAAALDLRARSGAGAPYPLGFGLDLAR